MTKGSLRYWYKKYGEDVPVKVIDVPEGYMVSTEPYEVHALEHLEESEFIVFSTGLRVEWIMNLILLEMKLFLNDILLSFTKTFNSYF